MGKNVNVLAMCLCLYLKYIIHTFSTISFKQIGRSPMFHLLIGHLLILNVSIIESIFKICQDLLTTMLRDVMALS
jgi:hypothetical protein